MQGQAAWFLKFAPEKIGYAINRYVNESKRLLEVVDGRLKDHEWLAADEYTIAGMHLHLALARLLSCSRMCRAVH